MKKGSGTLTGYLLRPEVDIGREEGWVPGNPNGLQARSQPKKDLVRVGRGNLGFFAFIFSFCFLFYAGGGSLAGDLHGAMLEKTKE